MSKITHNIARATFEAKINKLLKELKGNREQGLLDIADISQKYMGNIFLDSSYDTAREAIKDPNNKWMKYINKGLDELDPNVIRMTALNLGFEAAFHGTKTIRKSRKINKCNRKI